MGFANPSPGAQPMMPQSTGPNPFRQSMFPQSTGFVGACVTEFCVRPMLPDMGGEAIGWKGEPVLWGNMLCRKGFGLTPAPTNTANSVNIAKPLSVQPTGSKNPFALPSDHERKPSPQP
jgi:hypothetical protein